MTLLATRPRLQPYALRRLSTVRIVDRIEPILEFWVDRLGFEVSLKVDGPVGLEYVRLGREGAELDFRTRDSLDSTVPGLLDLDGGANAVLYLEVCRIDAILDRLDEADIVVPARETPFGGREVYVRDPSGRIIALISHE
jgi:catechol 2,3-dioxygenase-like lactoylglutathione lyase family enzyme